MINRENYHDVHAYLHYMERRQLDPATVKRARGHLRHLLEWADETPFTKARASDPSVPAYLATPSVRIVQPFNAPTPERRLAPASIIKCLANARQFFAYAHSEWTLRYKHISASWIDLLQPPRHLRAESRLIVRQYWSLEDAQKVAAVSTETLREERGQVAVCMLYLSGMRAEALASLPIHCVDLSADQIKQLPEEGVRTKNRKAAITFLLPIPELHDVVVRWDQRVRSQLPAGALWYATLTSDGMRVTPTLSAYTQRYCIIEDDVRLICQRAGVPYKYPHQLRHGHAVYGLKNARTIEELKAVSQNIMHASMTITDGIYANLLTNEVQSIITNLGKIMPLQQNSETADLSQKITELLDLLKPK
jgi:site-specific recombinase XerD